MEEYKEKECTLREIAQQDSLVEKEVEEALGIVEWILSPTGQQFLDERLKMQRRLLGVGAEVTPERFKFCMEKFRKFGAVEHGGPSTESAHEIIKEIVRVMDAEGPYGRIPWTIVCE